MSEDPISLADVRPGDVFFTNIGGFVPGVFPVKAGMLLLGERARIGRRSFDHVGMVTAGISEAMTGADAPFGPLLANRGTGMFHEHPRAVQAMPRGAEEIALPNGTHWTNSVTFMRIPEDYRGQAQDAATIARAMIGTPYSFISYAALAMWRWGIATPRLEKWINRRREPEVVEAPPPGICSEVALPAEAICSVLVDQAWSLAGKRIMEGVPHQCVTPGALAERLLWMPGVKKFGKGIL